MCYSKEVQLATGSAIIVISIFYYILYVIKYNAIKEKWLIPFLKFTMAGFLYIGGHQIFEFLSLVTENQIIYKTGLIISISAMFFFLKSLEVLLNRKLHSHLALVLIAAVAVHAFLTPMSFQEQSFYLRHNNVSLWSYSWIFLFFYFNVCALFGLKFLPKNSSRKTILAYLLATLDISFILALIYAIWGYSQFSVNICKDTPSIWCTFYLIQIFAIPFFLSILPAAFKRPAKQTQQTWKEGILYLLVTLTILGIVASFLPFFDCAATKIAFP
ncbi:hypothetical protein KKC94_00135 [Patescibacteria group bacterium]|nr:hypothetical protein [Patescibacteria group bacterium]